MIIEQDVTATESEYKWQNEGKAELFGGRGDYTLNRINGDLIIIHKSLDGKQVGSSVGKCEKVNKMF